MAKTKNNPSTVPTEKFDLKKLSWVFILVLGAGLFYALTLLPSSSGPQPTFHVASRYIERGAQETGFSNLWMMMGVWADYRSFDLILLSFVFLAGTFLTLLLYLTDAISAGVGGFVLAFESLLSVLTILGVGLICSLKYGGNFLDYDFFPNIYDFFPNIFGLSLERQGAAMFAITLFGLSAAASWGLFLKFFLRKKEKRHDR